MSPSELSKLLDYHIVPGKHFVGYSANLPNATILKSRQGENLTITFASNSLFVNSARVLQEDILISNGVLHVIDNVLDYNASNVKPVPAIPTQPAVLQGAPLSGNVVPFASDLPTSVSASITSGGAMHTSTKKGAGHHVEVAAARLGGLFGAVVLGAGFF